MDIKTNELNDKDADSIVGIDSSEEEFSTSITQTREDDSTSKGQEVMAKKETVAVLRLRWLVILVLLLTALAVCLVVYYVSSNAEYEEFVTQYDGVAEKLEASWTDILIKMGSVSSLGVALTAETVEHRKDWRWPFVTLTNFEQRAGNARHLSGALFVGISPIVDRSDFEAWDDFVNSDENNWM
jgi:hypothetical protein